MFRQHRPEGTVRSFGQTVALRRSCRAQRKWLRCIGARIDESPSRNPLHTGTIEEDLIDRIDFGLMTPGLFMPAVLVKPKQMAAHRGPLRPIRRLNDAALRDPARGWEAFVRAVHRHVTAADRCDSTLQTTHPDGSIFSDADRRHDDEWELRISGRRPESGEVNSVELVKTTLRTEPELSIWRLGHGKDGNRSTVFVGPRRVIELLQAKLCRIRDVRSKYKEAKESRSS